jgi:hypothetical protein
MADRTSGQWTQAKAAGICRTLELTDEARQHLRDDLTADAFLALLEARRLYDDALQVAVHWLPKREAVWWGCLCVWRMCRPDLPGPEAAAMQTVVQWVLDVNEENRRAAEKAAEAAGPATAAGCLALAAFWSGGSMAPAGLPEVTPPPELTAKMVLAALGATIGRVEPARKAESQRSFVRLAVEVVRVNNHWELSGDRAQIAAMSRPAHW